MNGKNPPALVSGQRKRGDAVIADVVGEVDLHNSPDLRVAVLAMLQDKSARRLVLHMGQVPYMDSSAVAVLVEALQKVRKIGGKVALVEIQPRVKGLLEIARLDGLFMLAATEDEAMG